MRTTQTRTQNTGQADREAISQVATGNARLVLLSAAINQEQQGFKLLGQAVYSPQVTALSLDASPPTATVTDCLDTSAVHMVDASGKPVALPSQATRYVATATVVQQNGRWLVSELAADRAHPC